MAIVFGSDIGVEPTSFQSIWQKLKRDAESAFNGFKSAWDTGRIPPPPKEKVYVDGGWKNVPGTAFLGSTVDSIDDIKERTITSQEPILTVYVKKRAFWSLRSVNDTKHLDRGEKLFLRATKLLFEKKCNQIGAYEALTKANRLLSENTTVDDNLIEQVIGYLEDGMDKYSEGLAEDIQKAFDDIASSGGDLIEVINVAQAELDWSNTIVENLRELQRRNNLLKHETRTSWVVDPNDSDLFSVGRGSGVIELTLVTNLNTSLSLKTMDTGSIDFTIEDPYNLTKITTDDLESALSAASAEIRSIETGASQAEIRSFYRGPKYYLDLATEKEEKLRKLRDGGGEDLSFSPANAKTLVDAVSGLDTVLKKPEILFQVNPTSSSVQNTVTGSVAGIETTFTKNDFAIVMFQQLPVEHQPSSREMQLITDIFDALENYVFQSQQINTAHREANSDPDLKHARKNLRLHYLGKNIVQPMDTVHVYIRGNTVKDGTLAGPLSSILGNSKFIKKFENDGSVSQSVIEEEMSLLGLHDLNINQDLYKSLRTSGMLRNAGIHVFGGLIKAVSDDYNASSGKYTTRVSGESNMRWLDLSRVNKTPSLDQTQGVLEDPLTPYDIETDEVTGLIKSRRFNKTIRDRIKELRFDNSSEQRGKKLDGTPGGNSVQNVDEETIGIIEKLKHIPGMASKWKSGIIVATRNVNLRTPLDGSDDSTDKLRRDMALTIIKNPFAGQDAANIVSLLVTGFPHNYESFYERGLSTGTFNNNVGSNSPQSYFESFFDITRSTNSVLGGFEPLKVIRKDPRTAEKYVSDQVYLQTKSKDIDRLRIQLAEFQGRLAQLTQTSLVGDDTGEVSKEQGRLKKSIRSIIDGIEKQITDKKKAFDQKSNQLGADVGMKFSGDDRAFEFISGDSEEENSKQNLVPHRIRNSMLQIRSQYDCKFNVDKNAFIIGDEYDKDLDLQAYAIAALGSQAIDLWNSQYQTPKEICAEVSKILDFEFYCDSQGHINFRPPRYNKVPLSLLLKMLLLEQKQGIKLYPDALGALFNRRKSKAKEDREILDLEIKVQTILLGGSWAVQKEAAVTDKAIISARESVDIEINPEGPTEGVSGDLVTALIDARAEYRGKIGGSKPNPNDAATKEAAEKELASLNDPSVPNMYVRRLKQRNKLSQMISRRELLRETEVKLEAQGKKFNETGTDYLTKPNEEILASYEDLIEDDFNDLLGPGSSKRFIIYDDQIINSNFTESDNEIMVRINVTGEQDLTGDRPGNLGNTPVLWAGATDFDLWRQYGYRNDGDVNKPFLKNAETQCAPYALMLLSRSRRNAIVGSVTLYGNEYYQLGDVVYINSRDMLFYVTAVRHNFSYEGGTFTTSLELRYGHPLGDYILTPLDVMGKTIIKRKKDENKSVSVKKISKELGVPIGVVKFDKNPKYNASDSVDDKVRNELIGMLSGDFAYVNVDSLKDALSLANPHIGTAAKDSYPKVEVRGFLIDDSDADLVKERMKVVREWLKNPNGRYIKNTDKFIKISDPRYMKIKLESGQIADNPEPILLTKGELSSSDIARLPSVDVFNLRDKDGRIDNVIEMVMIYEEIKDDE